MGQEEGWIRNRKVAAGQDFRTPMEKFLDGDTGHPDDIAKNALQAGENKAKLEKAKALAEENAEKAKIAEQKALADAEMKNASSRKKNAVKAEAALKLKK